MVKMALLIGVSEYEPGLTPLPAAAMDVQALAKVLQHPEIGRFAQQDVKQLVNPNAGKMQAAIEKLFGNRHEDDLALLYFSGHALTDDTGKLYLATSITRKNPQGQLVKETAVPASFVHRVMNSSRSKRQIVILDSCFSEVFAKGSSPKKEAKKEGGVDIYTQLGSEGRVILISSSTQYSFESQAAKLSTYTRYLIEGIETGVADRDNDGAVSLDELHEYALKKVQEAAPAMQPEIYGVKENFKLQLFNAPIVTPNLKYFKAVERLVSRGEIPVVARRTLHVLGNSLGLTLEDAVAIEAKVLQPYQEYQQKLQQYEHSLAEAVKSGYPVGEDIRHKLKHLQQYLGLRDEDIAPIEAKFIPVPVQKSQPLIGVGITALISVIAMSICINIIIKNTPNAQTQTPVKISTFADLCLNKKTLSPNTEYTVKVLLTKAGTQDCQQASEVLSSRPSLSLKDSKIVDLSPLSSFTHLTSLDLSNNKIEDLTALSSLTNLQLLNLNQNKIDDVSKLTLRNLQALYLWNNQITDITAISNLTNLRQLNLGSNKIVIVQPLSSLTNLKTLNLYNNQIEDVTPLKSLTNLELLVLSHNQIKDIKPLKSLIKLDRIITHSVIRNE